MQKDKGRKKMEKCPRCNDDLIVINKGGEEVLKCESCKYEVKKNG